MVQTLALSGDAFAASVLVLVLEPLWVDAFEHEYEYEYEYDCGNGVTHS